MRSLLRFVTVVAFLAFTYACEQSPKIDDSCLDGSQFDPSGTCKLIEICSELIWKYFDVVQNV